MAICLNKNSLNVGFLSFQAHFETVAKLVFLVNFAAKFC